MSDDPNTNRFPESSPSGFPTQPTPPLPQYEQEAADAAHSPASEQPTQHWAPQGPPSGEQPAPPQNQGHYPPQYPPPGQYQQGGYPQGQYAQQPGPYQPGGPPYQSGPLPQAGYGRPDYLAGGPGIPPTPTTAYPYQQPPRRKRRGLLVGVSAAVVAVLGAGGAVAYSTLAGSTTTLDAQLPADTAAYLEINTDPPAGQKVAALKFLRKFPDLKVSSNSSDLVESVVEPVLPNDDARTAFSENVKPWLGKHLAVAADPQDGKAQPVIVLETTDAGKAEKGLDALKAKYGGFAYVLSGKVVVMAETEDIAKTAVADAKSKSLADNGTFSADLKTVGDGGIATFWVDLKASAQLGEDVAESLPGSLNDDAPTASIDPSKVSGRLVGSMKFTDSSADLVLKVIGATGSRLEGGDVGSRLGNLPADTALAVGLSGGDKLVREAYAQLESAGLRNILQSAEEDLGIDLPGDLADLVGSSSVFAVGGTQDEPGVGLVSATKDPTKARQTATKLLEEMDGGDSVVVRAGSNNETVIANSDSYAAQLAGTGGLGSNKAFTEALPDAEGAKVALYLNFDEFERLIGEELPESAAALKAFGLTADTDGDTTTVHMRLTAN